MENRIRELRVERQMSQVQLAEALNTSNTSMNLWEQGRRLPPTDTLIRIASFFEVSLDYLLQLSERRIDSVDFTRQIEVEQLLALHTIPVWLEASAAWALVDSINRVLRLADGSTIPFSNIVGPIWGLPPQYSQPASGAGRPLLSEQLSDYTRVWVEPISPDPQLRAELRGWYRVCERYVANEFGQRFYFDRYAAAWLAFENCNLHDQS